MLKSKKAKLKIGIRKKLLINSLNIALKPVEKTISFGKKSAIKAKEQFPAIYRYFEGIVKHHVITPSKSMFTTKKFGDIGNFITASVMKRIPHVDESKVAEILNNPADKSLLETFTKGLGKAQKRSYTVLGNERFKRVLIANRGEIALRIIRACRELNIESVVIYSDEEADSLLVKFADRAYNIGKPKNYLNIRKIVKLAKKSGCDAIHPGYGFLSENPKFAKMCEKKGVKFIGPSSRMIENLGDKVQAKKAMLKANVPVIEGVKQDLKNKRHALKVAKDIGFPVIIKATAGGGGKGMRIVAKEEEIETAFDNAQKEAMNAFGDSSVYIESYLEDPRHVEFQILADRYGSVVHLGERDCSIQRRHQKLVEESPSPALDAELREKMGAAAVNAVKSVGYEGAGTVEFLLDKSRNFYFIEMNTRIQVEHGVTEMVTGVDLVKEQIKIAEGARLAFRQEDIKIQGYAIECRINAENPSNGFAPSPGTIVNYLPPGGPGIRVSSVAHAGYKILPQFDSLIALLICHGRTRNEAIIRMKRSLDEFIIEGVKTTIPFHKAVLGKRQFARGSINTSFIGNHNIVEELKTMKPKKQKLPKDKRIIIVTTAVAQYLAKKNSNGHSNNKTNPWITASRHESTNEGVFEE